MADINHVISLGIGSPAAIPEFLTLGLQISTVVTVYGPIQVHALQTYIPGAQAGEVYLPGASKADTYIPGGQRAQTRVI